MNADMFFMVFPGGVFKTEYDCAGRTNQHANLWQVINISSGCMLPVADRQG
jgi:hypothetical protein